MTTIRKRHSEEAPASSHAPPKRRRTENIERKSQSKSYKPLGYKALEEICKSSSPEDGIWDLGHKSDRFEALLNSKSEIRHDLMRLIIRAVHLCCSSEGVTQHADQILRLVKKTNFLHLHLSSFINQTVHFRPKK